MSSVQKNTTEDQRQCINLHHKNNSCLIVYGRELEYTKKKSLDTKNIFKELKKA